MEKNSYYVIFEVVKIDKKIRKGSTIEIGERFVGLYTPNTKSIYFIDVNGQEWIFSEGNNCYIIERF